MSIRRRWLLAGLVAAVAAAVPAGAYVIGGRVSDATTPRTVTISGTVTLTDTDFSFTAGCAGTGGYDDIRNGAPVVVTDAAGTTVALGELVGGKGVGNHVVGARNSCRWSFRIEGVPTGTDFYGVEVSHRGRVQVRAEKASEPVLLTLGG